MPGTAPAHKASAVRARARRTIAQRWPTAAAFAAYLAFSLFVTWPWVTDPTGTVYGVIGGDLTSNIAGFQQFAEERHVPFLPGEISQLNAPEELPVNWALHLAAIGSSTTLWLLSLAIGSVAAHGVIAVLGYTLSAFAMFLLVRSRSGHAGAAFVVGLAFGFWPYMYGTGYTWPHYIHLWVLVLLVWRMLVVSEAPTLRNGLLAGAAAALALTWIAYNLLIAGVVYATLAVLAVGRSVLDRRVRPQLVAQSAAAGLVALVLLSALVAGRASGYAGVPTRSSADLIANSARPAMYIVPGPRHPLFGERTEPWLYEHFSPTVPDPAPGKAIYADIYLGVSLVIFALVGSLWTFAMVWRHPRSAWRTRPVWSGVAAFIVGAVAFAFSAPPKVSVLGVLVPMPFALVEQVTDVFRVAHRFAIVLMLAACLLAGLALAALLRRRSWAVQLSAFAALTVVFAVDLSALPSPRTTKIDVPSVYRLLERQPPGIVAEYPREAATIVESEQSFYQDAHEHKLFAGAPPDSESESRKLELQFLLAKRTVPDLAEYGVSYVVVHPSIPPLVPPGQAVPGLRLINGDAGGTLYRVVARPSRFTSYGVRGFHLPEGDARGGGRWVGENGAELELRGRCRPCVGAVTFNAASFAEPRVLTIADERGRALFRGRVGVQGDAVRFRVRFSDRTLLRLSTDPPPVQINKVIPGPDGRVVSVYVAQPIRFVANRRRGHRPTP